MLITLGILSGKWDRGLGASFTTRQHVALASLAFAFLTCKMELMVTLWDARQQGCKLALQIAAAVILFYFFVCVCVVYV